MDNFTNLTINATSADTFGKAAVTGNDTTVDLSCTDDADTANESKTFPAIVIIFIAIIMFAVILTVTVLTLTSCLWKLHLRNVHRNSMPKTNNRRGQRIEGVNSLTYNRTYFTTLYHDQRERLLEAGHESEHIHTATNQAYSRAIHTENVENPAHDTDAVYTGI